MRPIGSRGTSLPEIMIALVIAGIITIGYSSMLMYTRTMYNDTVIRSQLSQDAYIVDKYVRSKLNLQLEDSLKIYADAAAENAETSSSSGTILRSVRIDSTVDHLAVESSRLVWKIDSLTHFPIDSDISYILFSTRSGYSKTILDVSMSLSQGSDTLALEWIVSLRN
jgi:Tfp pilus assembly protein PilE